MWRKGYCDPQWHPEPDQCYIRWHAVIPPKDQKEIPKLCTPVLCSVEKFEVILCFLTAKMRELECSDRIQSKSSQVTIWPDRSAETEAGQQQETVAAFVKVIQDCRLFWQVLIISNRFEFEWTSSLFFLVPEGCTKKGKLLAHKFLAMSQFGVSMLVTKHGCCIQSVRSSFLKPLAWLAVEKPAYLGGQELTSDLLSTHHFTERLPLKGHSVAGVQVFSTTRCW